MKNASTRGHASSPLSVWHEYQLQRRLTSLPSAPVGRNSKSTLTGRTAAGHTLSWSVWCVCGCLDMPAAMMTGLRTRPVTPTPQTTVSVCEADFKKGDFAPFQLPAEVRSGTQFNINNKHPRLAWVSASIRLSARVYVGLIECVFLCSANVFSLISPDIITLVSVARRHGCC